MLLFLSEKKKMYCLQTCTEINKPRFFQEFVNVYVDVYTKKIMCKYSYACKVLYKRLCVSPRTVLVCTRALSLSSTLALKIVIFQGIV